MDSIESANLIENAKDEGLVSDRAVKDGAKKWWPRTSFAIFALCTVVATVLIAQRNAPRRNMTYSNVVKAVMFEEKEKHKSAKAKKEELVDKDTTPVNCNTCIEKINEKQFCDGFKKFVNGKIDENHFHIIVIASFFKGPECFELKPMQDNFDPHAFCLDPASFSLGGEKDECGDMPDDEEPKKQEEPKKNEDEKMNDKEKKAVAAVNDVETNETKIAKAMECKDIENCKPCLTHAQCAGMEDSRASPRDPPAVYCCPRLKKCIDRRDPDKASCYGSIVCGKPRKELGPGERPTGCSQFKDGYPMSCVAEECKTWDPVNWVKC